MRNSLLREEEEGQEAWLHQQFLKTNNCSLISASEKRNGEEGEESLSGEGGGNDRGEQVYCTSSRDEKIQDILLYTFRESLNLKVDCHTMRGQRLVLAVQ